MCGNAAPSDRATATDSAPGRPEPFTRRLNLPKLPAKPSILGAAASTSDLDLEPPASSEKAGGRSGGREGGSSFTRAAVAAAHSATRGTRCPLAFPACRGRCCGPTRLRRSCSGKDRSARLPACLPARLLRDPLSQKQQPRPVSYPLPQPLSGPPCSGRVAFALPTPPSFGSRGFPSSGGCGGSGGEVGLERGSWRRRPQFGTPEARSFRVRSRRITGRLDSKLPWSLGDLGTVACFGVRQLVQRLFSGIITSQ